MEDTHDVHVLSADDKQTIYCLYAKCRVFRNKLWNPQIPSTNCLDSIYHRSTNPDWYMNLTSLDDITEEDLLTVGEMDGFENIRYSQHKESLLLKVKEVIEERCEMNFKVYFYLIQKEYAVPIWFGKGHSANGWNPIQLNIAVDKKHTNESNK